MPTFLKARFHQIVVLSYSVDPHVLQPLTPAGPELDLWLGRGLCSLVALVQTDLRVLSVPLPYPRRMEQVNLRFYVKRELPNGEVRRGVVFVAELVPYVSVTLAARRLYGENYLRARITGPTQESGKVEYLFEREGIACSMGIAPQGEWRLPLPATMEHFVLERYCGFTRRGRRISELRLEHPPWQMRKARESWLRGEAAKLFGIPLGTLAGNPASALLASGSEVTLHLPSTRNRRR